MCGCFPISRPRTLTTGHVGGSGLETGYFFTDFITDFLQVNRFLEKSYFKFSRSPVAWRHRKLGLLRAESLQQPQLF